MINNANTGQSANKERHFCEQNKKKKIMGSAMASRLAEKNNLFLKDPKTVIESTVTKMLKEKEKINFSPKTL
jgi:hypothetical protein